MIRTLLTTILLLASTHVYAYCEAILENGIFDVSNTSNDLDQFSTAQRVHCDKRVSEAEKSGGGNASIGYKSFQIGGGGSSSQQKKDSAQFCIMSSDEYLSSGKYRNAVKTINQGIVGAWLECRKINVDQVLHYITPSENPNVFSYKIQFNRNPDSKSIAIPLTNWDVLGGSCRTLIEEGTEVTYSGMSSICTRESTEKAVTIIADAKRFGKYLKPVEMKGYIERKPVDSPCPALSEPNYYECLKTHIENGKKISITFDERAGDDKCVTGQSKTWLGNIMAGKTYTTYYVPAEGNWATEGPMQGDKNCASHNSRNDNNTLIFDRNSAEMNLWVGRFRFDEVGVVYYGLPSVRVGKINNPF